MHLRAYLMLLQERERQLADALATLADYHADEPELSMAGQLLAAWSERHSETLAGLIAGDAQSEPGETTPAGAIGAVQMHSGSYGLVADLHSLWVLAQDVRLRWSVLGQVAWALHDRELSAICSTLEVQTEQQLAWLRTHMAESAPQAIIASP